MSRPKPRGAAIADRLSAALQDDLVDIASTMDWIDAAPVADGVVPPVSEEDRPAAAPADPLHDSPLDLMLDDFAFAVDAMFSNRAEVLAAGAPIAGLAADAPAADLAAGLTAGAPVDEREPVDVDSGSKDGNDGNGGNGGNEPQVQNGQRQG